MASLALAAGCNAMFGLGELSFEGAASEGGGGVAASSSGEGGFGASATSTGGAGGGSGGSGANGAAGGGGTTVSTPTAVTAGAAHTCALLADGALKCWGSNKTGELGVPAKPGPNSKPLDIAAFGLLAEVSAGGLSDLALGHTCARTLLDNKIRCWGDDSWEELGSNNGFPDLPGASTVSAGAMFSCAVAAGKVKCWGRNDFGQVGNSDTGNSSSTPSAVPGLGGVSQVSCGGNFACAVSAGRAYCWGNNASGELGKGQPGAGSPDPVEVVGLTDVAAISTGMGHACALTTTGQVLCWGANGSGQLGNGSLEDSSSPANVSLPEIAKLSVGGQHSCAIDAAGGVHCWGANVAGQVGAEPLGNGHTFPKIVNGLGSASSIDAGDYHTCAILDGGELYCWGANNYGQLGDGTTANSATPVKALP